LVKCVFLFLIEFSSTIRCHRHRRRHHRRLRRHLRQLITKRPATLRHRQRPPLRRFVGVTQRREDRSGVGELGRIEAEVVAVMAEAVLAARPVNTDSFPLLKRSHTLGKASIVNCALAEATIRVEIYKTDSAVRHNYTKRTPPVLDWLNQLLSS